MKFGMLLWVLVVFAAWAQPGRESPDSLAAQAPRAYRSIPHEYTVFQPAESGLAADVAESLRQYFVLLDAAVVARVDATDGLRRGRAQAYQVYDYRMAEIEMALQSLAKQSSLAGVVRETQLALADQRAFLLEWSGQPGPNPGLSGHPKVVSASGHLRKAYALLQTLFPKGSANVQKSNYNCHCALDFI